MRVKSTSLKPLPKQAISLNDFSVLPLSSEKMFVYSVAGVVMFAKGAARINSFVLPTDVSVGRDICEQPIARS